MKDTHEKVRRFMIAFNRIDELYVDSVRTFGVKGNLFVLFYAIADGKAYSQRQICDDWELPRTTLNTIVRECVRDGLVRLVPRGYHARSLNSNGGWNKTSALSFINVKLLAYAGEIEGAVMVLHGEKAHSRYFGEDAFKMLKGDNKELVIVPGASHCDLYDGGGKNAIPFDRIEAFYRKNLK